MRALVLLLSVCSTGCVCVAPQHPPTTGRVEEHELASAAVGDTYRIFVRLPPAYDATDAKYPVIVQLDANLPVLEEFDVTAGFASDLEARGEVPPSIVVGVGYPYDANLPGKGRARDYTLPMRYPDDPVSQGLTGGAPQFYGFLRAELAPWLERTYRVAAPGHRALFGHSLGGLFTAWAFTQHDAHEPLFGAFVAASPSLNFDRGGFFVHLEAARARTNDFPVALQVTDGALEGPVMTAYDDELLARLETAHFTGLKLESHRYKTDHVGSVAPSFQAGVRFVSSAVSP